MDCRKYWLSEQFRKIVTRYKTIGYNMEVMLQTEFSTYSFCKNCSHVNDSRSWLQNVLNWVIYIINVGKHFHNFIDDI